MVSSLPISVESTGFQPEHVGIVVIPERHHQDNTCINCLLDLAETTLLEEIGAVLGFCNPVFAEVIGDAVMLISIDSVAWVLDFFAILSVELFDLHELARICAIIGDELRGHGDWLGGINLEFRARTKEVLVAKAVRLEVATVLVAQTLEAIRTVVSAIGALTARLSVSGAGVHGVGCADGVRFPDVDLSAAAAIFASASIDISLAWIPVFSVGLAIDELEVMPM